MGVGNSPAPGIHTDKIRVESFFNFSGYDTSDPKKALRFFFGKVMPPGHMSFGNDQTVALGQRVDIQQTQGQLIFMDNVGFSPALSNFTKNAFF
jgi:hypothetical protein